MQVFSGKIGVENKDISGAHLMTLPTNTKTFIYGLFCPDTDDLRYVGKSNNPKLRLFRHIDNAKRGKSYHCSNWIRSLLREGKKPVLKIIEKCNVSDWKSREVFWIDFYRSQGFDLTNCKAGGDGIGFITDETRKRMSAAKLGKTVRLGMTHSEESKRKMSESAKAKYKNRPDLRERNKENQKFAASANRGLTEDQVKEVKRLFASGLRIGLISKQTNINIPVLEKIQQGKNYAWVRI